MNPPPDEIIGKVEDVIHEVALRGSRADPAPYFQRTRRRVARLARLIVLACDDEEEAVSVASRIPRARYGTFRFVMSTKEWVMLYSQYDH